MKKFQFLIVLSLIIQTYSCSSFKEELTKIGDENNAVNNAIIDFSHTSSLYKRDSVFIVKITNLDNDKVVVSIGKSNAKILIKEVTKVGTKGLAPSRYVLNKGKLFYWWDNNHILTQDALDVFSKYKIIQFDENESIMFADFEIDEKEKGVDYFFCRKNLTNYKKVTTNIGLGYYEAPYLDCGAR